MVDIPPAAPLQEIFVRAEGGDAAARETLFAMLYDELHRLAHSQVARARGAMTWDTTTLLHEAYLGISRREGLAFPDRARFLGGVQALSAIFNGTLAYDITSVTSEAERTVAEVSSRGTLNNGEAFHNTHVFLFTVRDGRIAVVKEFMNQFVVREQLVPLLQAMMANRTG